MVLIKVLLPRSFIKSQDKNLFKMNDGFENFAFYKIVEEQFAKYLFELIPSKSSSYQTRNSQNLVIPQFKVRIKFFNSFFFNNGFNVSHSKGTIFLTGLYVGLSHLCEHKFKYSLFDSLNPICNDGFNIETLNNILRCPIFARFT